MATGIFLNSQSTVIEKKVVKNIGIMDRVSILCIEVMNKQFWSWQKRAIIL